MRILGLLFFLAFSNVLSAQKILQLERFGSAKVKKFYIGDELTYRVKGDKTWYTGTIQNLIIEENIILFENRFIKLENITILRERQGWSQKLGNQLYFFALSWLGFSSAGTLVGWEFRWDTVIIAGSAVATGWLIKKIFKYKKYKIGKKRRLRLLDLTLIKPIYGP